MRLEHLLSGDSLSLESVVRQTVMDGARLFLRGSPESGAFLLVLTVPVFKYRE